MIKKREYNLALVFNTILFPFTYPDIDESLTKRHYGVNYTSKPLHLVESRSYVGGNIATKKGCTISINPNKKILGIQGNNVTRVLDSIKDLEEISSQDFQLDLEEDVLFCELTAKFTVEDDTSPIENMGRFMDDKYSSFDEIMGTETSAYAIRIVPKGAIPSSKNWFDITIFTRPTRPKREYYVSVVYRSENIDHTLTFASEINSKIESLIKAIGGS